MKIIRNGKEIELTPEELRQAYDEQNKFFRKEDIKREFAYLYLGTECEAEDTEAWVEGEEYDIDYDSNSFPKEVAQQIREDFDSFLEKVFEILNNGFDANFSENIQIENAIEEAINRMN